MIRLLIIVALIWVAWKLLRNALENKAQDSQSPTAGNSSTRMVKCEQCGVHLPEDEATLEDGHVFCSQRHLAAWQDSQDDD